MEKGTTVRVHYVGTLDDGTQFDSSRDRGETLEFQAGTGMMIPGFDKAVVNMEVGEKVHVHLMPEEAYGPSNPNAIFDAPISVVRRGEELEVGMRIYLQAPNGQPFPATIVKKTEDTFTFDANHEMAGKELNFDIELVEVAE